MWVRAEKMDIQRYLKAADKPVQGYKVLKPNVEDEEHIRVLAGFIVDCTKELDRNSILSNHDLEEQIGYWTAKSICNERYSGHYFSRLFFKKADSKWIGFILGRVIKDRIPFAHIDMVYFVPEERGNLVNGRIVSVALGKMAKWVLSKGITYLTVSCSYDDRKGFQRLSALGMKPIEIRFAANLNAEEIKKEEEITPNEHIGTIEPFVRSRDNCSVSTQSVG